jgi:hypothetical protein
MKVIQLNKDKVIIQIRPVFLTLFGLFFVLIGAGLTLALTEYSQIECSRTGNNPVCMLTQLRLTGYKQLSIPHETLIRARVKERIERDNERTYKVAINTSKREYDLTSVASGDRGRKDEIVKQINTFIEDKSLKTLFVQDSSVTLGVLFGMGLVFLVAGLLIVVLVAKVNIYIDKSTQTLTLIKKSIVRKTVEVYSLQEIAFACLDQDEECWRILLKKTDKTYIPLHNYSSSGRKSKQKIVDTINQYINLYKNSVKQ